MQRDEFFRLVGGRYNLNYTDTAGVDYYDMVRTFREGVNEVLKRVPFLKSRNTSYAPGAVAVVDVHTLWDEILGIFRNSDSAPLVRTSVEDINELKLRGATSVFGTTYYAWEEGWLHLYPTPGASDQFTVEFNPIVDTTAFTASTDPSSVGIPEPHQQLVLEWMLMRAAEYQGNVPKATYHRKAFDEQVRLSLQQRNRKGGSRPRAKVGYPSRRSTGIGSRNDVYPS